MIPDVPRDRRRDLLLEEIQSALLNRTEKNIGEEAYDRLLSGEVSREKLETIGDKEMRIATEGFTEREAETRVILDPGPTNPFEYVRSMVDNSRTHWPEFKPLIRDVLRAAPSADVSDLIPSGPDINPFHDSGAGSSEEGGIMPLGVLAMVAVALTVVVR